MHGLPGNLQDSPSVGVASRWTAAHLAQLQSAPATTLPLINADLPRPLFPGLDLWDMWPLQDRDGHIADMDGGQLWFILSAPQLADPDDRHFVARIRLAERRDGQWIDHGNAFADGFTPGSREWAGSAVRTSEDGAIEQFFTAAGYKGDARDNWAQRIFACTGRVNRKAGRFSIAWDSPREVIRADSHWYRAVTADIGRAGFIKGFRDPAWFRDPADGCEYLLFTASLYHANSDYDGAIGCARRSSNGNWHVRAPLLTMDGSNNEPERPHLVWHDGHYYLFFSTQTRMFAPDVPPGPNGLYAFFAASLTGAWTPVNGSGLVAANPPESPWQAYSWWVTADLSVYGFADLPGLATAPELLAAGERRRHFAGVPAPVFRLVLDGATARIAND